MESQFIGNSKLRRLFANIAITLCAALTAQAAVPLSFESHVDFAVVNNSGAVKFVDESAPSAERRFYRARLVTP